MSKESIDFAVRTTVTALSADEVIAGVADSLRDSFSSQNDRRSIFEEAARKVVKRIQSILRGDS